MVPWDFGSLSPRAKFVSYVHGYTCTSKDWFMLLFIQNSSHCNKVVCLKHHFCLYSDCSRLFLRLLPTCYHRNRNINSTLYSGLLPTCYHRNRNINSTLYQGCYPLVTIETGTSFVPSTQGCYPLVTIEMGTTFVPSTQAVPTFYP